jgi:hypothetical protein
MSFADNYLQKHALRGPLISTPPPSQLHCIVAIPSYKESGLVKCLDSLFLCDPSGVTTEVIVLINAAEDSKEEVLAVNRASYKEMQEWIRSHQRDDLIFHALYVDQLPAKHAGAGLARKLVMDEAVRRLGAAGNEKGIVLSMDADATVEKNYLTEVARHFDDKEVSGCAIYFEHPLSGEPSCAKASEDEKLEFSVESYSPEVYEAITNYELHLRYYLNAVRYTGYPYAFHTVGSSFAVLARTYCSQGGMNKRQAGEDFYFIQKVARLGTFTDLCSTTVYPSPRPSDRVVFGTGPDIRRQLENPGAPYLSYDFRLFEMLREFFACAGSLFEGDEAALIYPIHTLLLSYLKQTKYAEVLQEMRDNAASETTFVARFYRHFNMLWILKFLHWAEANGYGKVEVGEVAGRLLSELQYKEVPRKKRNLLSFYRKIDRI